MASLDELSTALRNADAAGDADAARVLAAEIQRQQKPAYSGSFLPFSRDATGVHFDSNAGVLGSLKNAFMLPGRAVQESSAPPKVASDSDVSAVSVPSIINFGAIANPVNPGVRAGDRAFPGVSSAMAPKKPITPTTAELAEAGARDIQAAKDTGLAVSPSAVADHSRKVQQGLFEDGIHPVDAPATFAKLKELENAPPGATFTAANLQSLRSSLGHTAQNFNPNAAKDQLAASRAIKQLDQFLPSVNEADVVAGTPAATQKLFESGRGNYAAGMRSNDITGNLDRAYTGVLERAENRAQATNSGRNTDNTIRQKIASLLEKPKEVSGFSDNELDALLNVVNGGPARNTARYIGNLLGGGGGVGQSAIGAIGAGGGAVVGGIPGAVAGAAAPAVVGAASKGIANALARRSVNAADELIRQRSPLYKDRVENPEMYLPSPSKRSALIRALLLGQPQTQQ